MRKTFWLILVIIIVAVGFWIWSANRASAPANENENMEAAGIEGITGTTPAEQEENRTVTVTYTASGFSPSSITVQPGDTVVWKNESGGNMWVASAVHPSHETYDGNNLSAHCSPSYSGPAPFDQCGNGTEFSFTFDKIGNWKYHNHLDSSKFGEVIVE
jgi:plastocyanin